MWMASLVVGKRHEAMNEVWRAQFAQSGRLIAQCQGREIKAIGDSFMAWFLVLCRGSVCRKYG
jgi:class 3 adenylate cyclase